MANQTQVTLLSKVWGYGFSAVCIGALFLVIVGVPALIGSEAMMSLAPDGSNPLTWGIAGALLGAVLGYLTMWVMMHLSIMDELAAQLAAHRLWYTQGKTLDQLVKESTATSSTHT